MSDRNAQHDNRTPAHWDLPKWLARWLGNRYLPAGLVLAISLGVTLLAWQRVDEYTAYKDRPRFEQEVARIRSLIVERVRNKVDMLRAMQSFFLASQQVERHEWKSFVEGLDVDIYNPSVQCLAFIARVPGSELDEFVNEANADGVEITAPAGQDEYFIVKYLAPTPPDGLALGMDIRVEPAWRSALEKAAARNEPTLSNSFSIKSDRTGDTDLLFVLPAFSAGSKTNVGWVAAQLRVPSFLRGADVEPGFVDHQVFEGDSADRGVLLFSSRDKADTSWPKYTTENLITVGQRDWLLRFSTRPEFEQASVDRLTPLFVLLGGSTLSVLLSGMLWSASTKREAAVLLAGRMTRSLRESERKLQSIIDNTAAVVYIKDFNGHYLLVNGSFERLVGKSAEELLGLTDYDVYPRDMAEAFRENDRQVITSGQPSQVEELVPQDDGVHTFISNKFLLFDNQGKPYALCGVSTDITRQKRAEEALRESEARYFSLVESLPLNTWSKDLQGRFLFANKRWCDSHGRLLEKIVGTTDYDYSPRELAEKYRSDDQRVIDSRSVFEDIEEFRKPTGEKIFIQVLKAPMFDAKGNVVGTQGMSWDVTARRQAESALRESREHFVSILETASDAFVGMDLDGFITDWNRQAERTFGWSRAEAIGRTVVETIVPDHLRDTARRGLERFLATHEGSWLNNRIESTALHRNGHEFPIEITVWSIGEGESLKFNAFIRDITARKQVDAALRQAKDDAEAASRAKSAFLANMSHEIRTPMNGIIGMTELLLDSTVKPEQREYLEMVRESADSLLSIINDVLDFSKVEAGKLELDRHVFELRDCVGDSIKTLGLRAHTKRLELACQIQPEVPDMLLGDSGRLRQILLNLVGNAVKFTEQGEVLVSVTRESRENDETLLHFSVSDTGIGIPTEKHQTIFEAFEQADTSTTRKYGGTGLGLAISARLVELMGGRIWLESRLGRGSIFHFTARFGVLAVEPATAGYAKDIRGLKVLVVDDNATNRRVLGDMLTNWDMKPVLAGGGDEALLKLREAIASGDSFSLVLVDSNMPGMDGFMLTSIIKADPRLAPATIMMLTSGDRPGDAQRSRELGIAAYLIKPIKQSELLDSIVAVISPRTLEERVEDVPRTVVPRRCLNILVAEDSLVNQKLAVTLLEKWGHKVHVASNGKEAVAAMRAQPFDLVLMDVQMPEMDGFEATAAIRRAEQPSGKHVPIVATTAHALKGDRERCLQAGMDDYLCKPIRPKQLIEVIEALCFRNVESLAYAAASEGVIDREAALAGVEGDANLLGELVNVFLDECPKLLNDIDSAIGQADSTALRRAAHTLKGAIGHFAADGPYQAALKLEQMGRQGDLSQAAEACLMLKAEIERMRPALAGLNNSHH